MKTVHQPIIKLDAKALVTGKPVYTEDLAPSDCLVVKLLRSPHAYAKILEIKKDIALKVPGIECILTYEDVPQQRFTMAGQSYPEPSPYDRLILDKYVRYVGDPVAIVAGENEKAVDRALKLIKVQYEILEPVLDFEQAIDHPSCIHQEEDYHVNFDIGNEVKRNICCKEGFEAGDINKAFSESDVVLERTYHTKANNQAMMETFKTYTYLDYNGRLNIVTATQIPFHVRRILARALDMPKSKVRVIKPRIGGGFGAKQTVVSEPYPALVTLKTGKPARLFFTRKETFMASTSRHEMKITVKIGADKEGHIKGIEMYTLSNTGAYGEHGPTTVGLSGHKTMSLYNKAEALKFSCDVVYSNTMSAGAFRGYGATQGTFALESAMNELAVELNMDPIALRKLNMLEVGESIKAYYGEILQSCGLLECLETGKKMIEWDKKYPSYRVDDHKVRGVGMAMTMQGSGISNIDIASSQIRLNDDGFYTLLIGAADMGTGCDTILAQMAAECLECDLDKIVVNGVDTDQSPYDTGSYASSTTYVTGMSVIKACEELKEKMLKEAALQLGIAQETLIFEGHQISNEEGTVTISLDTLAQNAVVGEHDCLIAQASHSSPVSPPPFMVGFAEVEVDTETGHTEMIDYVGVVDCGTVINTSLARIQAEGGIAQGIGMALYEDITYTAEGKMRNNTFMQHNIPTRLDVGNIRVAFESTYEPTGPFGAKSIGEVVINTPCPAIAHAIYNATGVRVRELPITPEKIILGGE
ncbi:MAG: molybdopterin-dependent oxidoreductase [Clostridiales bacterium]|jgi:putative selenate reductase molybdopterin-binding subunit|nr:molybdopterin-dependent oxidoreductase [Clostridiales bacterium]